MPTPLGHRLNSLFLILWQRWHQRQRQKEAPPRPRRVESTPPAPPGRRPRVLWVTPFPPWPMIHGSAVRQHNLLRHLSATCDLYLFVYIGGTDDPELRRRLAPYARAVYLQHAAGAETASALPHAARRYIFPAVFDRLRALIAWHRIDLVQLEHTELGGLTALDTDARIVLCEHDISFRSYERRRRLGFAGRFARQESAEGASRDDWLRLVRYEVEACRRADQVHVMSRQDAAYLARSLADGERRLRVVPNGVDTSTYRPDPRQTRRDLLFVGSFPHLPNLDALDDFLDRIWPLVRRRLPDARLSVAGARPPQRVLDLDGQAGVRVIGEVDQLLPLYQSHRALVVPLRAGSGTRLKILEAFASGLPIVSTPLGSEGIACHPERHLLHARTPEDWLEAIGRVLEDDALVRRLSDEGRRLAVERYDWRRVGERLEAAHRELLGDRLSEAQEPPPIAGSASSSEAATGDPRISVLIPVEAPLDEEFFDRLDAIERQRLDHPFEIVSIDCGLEPEDRRRLAARDLHPVPGRVRGAGQITALNHGAAAARGRVLVFLAPRSMPQDDQWLAQLTAPFFEPRPPAAVRGPVWRAFGQRPSWHHVHAFTAEARRWRRRHGEPPFSLANAAIRRDVWSAHPFYGGAALGELAWQRQIAVGQGLILPILAAGVSIEEDPPLGELWRRLVAEGAIAWQLGERYSTLDLVADLLWPRLYRGHLSWLKVWLRRPSSLAELLFPWLRPLAVFCGQRLARWRPQWRRRLTRPPEAPR